jgi:2,4-dienoyl-CoA reductase-like NADH-dependent reductase (Old Yellow Enzyme family)
MTEKTLFQPYVLGDLVLANRAVMGLHPQPRRFWLGAY